MSKDTQPYSELNHQPLQQRIELLETELKFARMTISKLQEKPSSHHNSNAKFHHNEPTIITQNDISKISTYSPQTSVPVHELYEFSQLWLGRMDEDYFLRHSFDSLMKQSESLFNFIYHRNHTDILVRVLPTSKEDHHGCGMVVETCMTDQPFILDTLRMLFQEFDLKEAVCLHPILDVKREMGVWVHSNLHQNNSQQGHLHVDSVKESIMRWEFDHLLSESDQERLRKLATERLTIAFNMVRDFRKMLRRSTSLSSELSFLSEEFPKQEVYFEEVSGLLHWLRQEKFVFMSYERFDVISEKNETEAILDIKSRLGIASQLPPKDFPDFATKWLHNNDDIFFVGKLVQESTVHRPGKMDVVLVKTLDDNGIVNNVHVFSGLFTRKALSEQGGNIPVIREKLREMLQDTGVVQDSHLQRAMTVAFNSMPIEYLFGIDVQTLRQVIDQILSAETQPETGVFLRMDGSFASAFVLISIPRSRYSNELKERISHYLLKLFGATYEDHRELFGQHDNVLVYFYITAHERLNEVLEEELQQELDQMTRSWEEHVLQLLKERHSEQVAIDYMQHYVDRLPEEYRVKIKPSEALEDVHFLEDVLKNRHLKFRLANSIESSNDEPSQNNNQFTLYMYERKLTSLSSSLPILSNFGFEVASEFSFELDADEDEGSPLHINVFQVSPKHALSYNLMDRAEELCEAMCAIFEEKIENDVLNELILSAGVNWRLVDVLRAYIHYNRQLVSQSPLDFSRRVCLTYPNASKILLELFASRFNPSLNETPSFDRQKEVAILREDFMDQLRHVEISSEDKVLRNLFTLIEATLRTNFYQAHEYISFKFDPAKIDHMALPKPYREIYVHHPEVEGVHLRGGPIARGGIRWSDRYDDYRKEVLGLMTTQQVKNVVIVPVGSKGGFILKKRYSDRKFERKEADRLYSIFIQGLLDVTDNIVEGKTTPPNNVVRWDNDDPYLVVAADKGTAHLSNTANKISLSRHFWLGDAFASGGSNGYDHKELAITSRGAWVSVRRHFLEMNMDPETDPITCIGIGDMSGDVFGNGMLLSKSMKVLGAFNHIHIFVDPNPDPEKSYKERRRLFDTAGSTWEDYRADVISSGGGVFKRTAKAIELTKEMKELFSLDQQVISGEELIHKMLMLEVDLLWNGGIGTYVKASFETHVDVGDRVNDAVRVDAKELKVKVVGEGGNLGFTMAARLEFAANGGKLNTDALDNSGGVDTSDHEVNLKILFEPLCKKGIMTYEDRNHLLMRLSDEVCNLVLFDNYSQNLLLSLDERRSSNNLASFSRLIDFLERETALNRNFEGVPSNSEIKGRIAKGLGLYRPELSKILAYTKMYVYGKLLEDTRFEGQRVNEALKYYFPKEVIAGYSDYLQDHPLRKEIAATYFTNRIIDQAGSTFFFNIWEDASYDTTHVVFSYILINELLDAPKLKEEIRSLEGKVPAEHIYKALTQIEDLLAVLTRRAIRRNFDVFSHTSLVEKLKADFITLKKELLSVLPNETLSECERKADCYMEAGMSEDLSKYVAVFPELASGVDIALLKTASKLDLRSCAWLYYHVGEEIGLRKALGRAGVESDKSSDAWVKSALSLLRGKLIDLQYQISLQICKNANESLGIDGLSSALESFKQSKHQLLERVKIFEKRLQKAPADGVAPMVVLSAMLDELIQ